MRFLKEEPKILYQDEHILAVYKPPNMPTQPDSSKDYSILEWARHMIYGKKNELEPFLGLVHRLDRPVPGVIVFAKTKLAAKELSKYFRERKVTKVYWAAVEGIPTKKEDMLKQDFLQNRSGQKEIKEAILRYRVLSTFEQFSLLEVQLISGLRHQIRLQLSSINHPIINDARYGRIQKPYRCIGLLAKEISFSHPTTKKPVKIQSPVPRSFPWPKEKLPR